MKSNSPKKDVESSSLKNKGRVAFNKRTRKIRKNRGFDTQSLLNNQSKQPEKNQNFRKMNSVNLKKTIQTKFIRRLRPPKNFSINSGERQKFVKKRGKQKITSNNMTKIDILKLLVN